MNREILFRGKRIDNGESIVGDRYNSTQKYRKTPKGVLTNLYSKMQERNYKHNFDKLPFSKDDLHKRFLNDKTFHAIFTAWVDSNYQTKYKPSFDRINPLLGYSMENIRLTTWEENRKKADKEKTFIYTTPVVMFDINGNYIRDFGSTKEAHIATGISQGLITACCQRKIRYTGDYIFKYRGDKFRCSKTANEYGSQSSEVISSIHDQEE